MSTPPPGSSSGATARTAVLKFGGEVVASTALLSAVLADVAGLVTEGWRFVLCHGGGPQLNALQRRLGVEVVQVAGRRVTDDATLQVAKCVLAGETNVDVVAAAAGAGLRAVGISGVSAGLVTASRRPPIVVSGGGPDPVDFGHVGRIERVDAGLWAGGYTPVLNTLGVDAPPPGGGPCPVYNINADTVAAHVAVALGADHLFLMTRVPGVLRDKDDPTTRVPRLDAEAARRAIADGIVVGGMIPKIEEALRQLTLGVGAVHILGATPGALAAEATAPGSAGTALVP